MSERTCTTDGCDNPVAVREWCRKHYQAAWRAGRISERPTCSVEDCGKAVNARGWCSMHYRRWREYGDLSFSGPSLWDRFWPKVDADGPCWEWTGSLDRYGYGETTESGQKRKTHRVAWELLIGPIPEDLTLDHLCRNRACVNPDHLEPVTRGENVRRGITGALSRARAMARTHCPHGHAYEGSNVYITPRGARMCVTCKNQRQRERRASLRDAVDRAEVKLDRLDERLDDHIRNHPGGGS